MMKKYKWYYFWKKVHGHLCLKDYKIFNVKDNETDEDSNQFVSGRCEVWADNDSQGQNAGYEYGWEEVKKPPKEWLEKKIEDVRESIVHSHKYLSKLMEELIN